MANPTKRIRIKEDVWNGLKKMSEKKNKPIAHIIEDWVFPQDEIDGFFGYRPRKKKRGH